MIANAQIMVVEDEVIVAKNIEKQLKRLGYQVPVVTFSGEEALQKVAAVEIDLALMDIRLAGEMDGVATAEALKSRFNVPVIYLTALTDELTLQRAKLTEPCGYIRKPFELIDLQIAIEMGLYKHQAERKLMAHERWLATTLKSICHAVIAADVTGKVVFMNSVAEALTGWSQAEALNRDLAEVFNLVNATTGAVENPVARALRENRMVSLSIQALLVAKDGQTTPIDDCATPIQDDQGHIDGAVLIFYDITKNQQTELERELLIAELQEVVDTALSGILTICASCKRIQDDQGDWQPVEVYIRDHSEADFSHGLCPDCGIRLYPDFYKIRQ